MINAYKIRTISGLLIDPWNPSGPVPPPADIAHSLAHLNRYCGFTTRPLSVAEHSLLVALHLACGGSGNEHFKNAIGLIYGCDLTASYIVGAALRDLPLPRSKVYLALIGLTHDIAEAGLADVPGPVLRHFEMTAYKEAHDRYRRWLYDGWGIPQPGSLVEKNVKQIDVSILGAEMAIRPPGARDGDSGETFPPWEHLDLSKHVLTAEQAKAAWIATYHELRSRIDG